MSDPRNTTRLALVLLLLVPVRALRADKIHLKDGRTIEGHICDREGGQTAIRTKAGIVVVPSKDIMDPMEVYRVKRIGLADSDRQGWLDLAEFCCHAKLHAQARDALARATAQCRQAKILVAAARLYDRLLDREQARALYQRVTEIDPQYAPARQGLTQVMWNGRGFATFRDAVDAALQSQGAPVEACRQLALDCRSKGLEQEGLKLLAKTEDTDDVEYLLWLAKEYGRWRRPEAAKRVHEKVVQLDPTRDDTHRALGHVQLRGGWYGSPKAAYDAVVRSGPDTASARFELAQWCQGHGLEAEARDELFRVTALDPDHAQARAALGHVRVAGQWLSALNVRSIDWRREYEMPSPSGVRFLVPPKDEDWFASIGFQLATSLVRARGGRLAASDFSIRTQGGASAKGAAFAIGAGRHRRFDKTLTVPAREAWMSLEVLFISSRSRITTLTYKDVSVTR